MSKRLIGSLALTIAGMTAPAHAQPAAPLDQRAAWFANLPHAERDTVIHDVWAQYQRAVVGDAQAQQLARDRYRDWAWRDWRKDRGRASQDQ